MYDGFIQISVDHASDPDGSQLQKLLNLNLARESAKSVRRRWLFIAGLVWSATLAFSGAARSSGQPLAVSWLHPLAAAVRYVLALRAAIACVAEWNLRRRWSQAVLAYRGAEVTQHGTDDR